MHETGENVVATPLDIKKRLAALTLWQQEQKRLLQERQNEQRVMLGIEQRNMFEMLGIATQEEEEEEEDQEQQELSIQMPRHALYEEDQEEADLVEYNPGEQSSAAAKPKRPFLRRGEGLKQRFKLDPDKFRLHNLPRYEFANAHRPLQQKKSIPKQKNVKKAVTLSSSTAPPRPPPLSLKEQRFQQLLLDDKNGCSSTPDLKSSSSSSSNVNSSASPKVRFVGLKKMEEREGQSADDEQTSCDPSPAALTNMCWAKVLDQQQIRPGPLLHRRSAQILVENDDNVSIFELLEQKAREGNIDMNSSCIRTFMARKEQRREVNYNDDSDQFVVTQQLREMRLQPVQKQAVEVETEEDEDDDDIDEGGGDSNVTLTPLKVGVGKAQVHVRFSDSNDTHEYSDGTTLQDGSNAQLFEEFKTALFQALEQRKTPTNTQSPSKSESQPAPDPALTKELRMRLQELELEIATFKEQNTQLLRLKQQHELDQANCAQVYQEAMDRVHDEKMQAEIYLHDERMKIEEERRKFEQQMRLQKSNVHSKEKKELAALKQEVEALQLQLKQKEQTHISAQARLRAQLRANEKEQRQYQDEIELLGRENKRLEQELVKISRENNSKMLQEINRNIARLAPKAELAKNADENGKKPKKTISEVLQQKADKPPKHRVPVGRRNRKKSEPLNASYASSSSDELDEVVVPKPAAIPTPAPAPVPAESDPASHNNSGNGEYKRELVNADGSKDIWYPNGNLKKITSDGMSVRMLYFNKDIKETDIRVGTTKYYYAQTNTWHTTYLDGLEILEFPNGQTEHRYKNGTIEIHFPNNTIKTTDPNNPEVLEEWRYADGTHLVQFRNGDKILNLPNGQKEIHTTLNKRREYPDGTVKLLYPDGSQETRYSNGRVRLKDKDGKLIMDTDYAKY